MKTCNPYPPKPVPVDAGTGFGGYGCGLPWKTPGLPVTFPIKDGKWKMWAAVIGFKALSGTHDGENLERYVVGLLDRVGIIDKKGTNALCWFWLSWFQLSTQLYTATLDNTTNNDTTCKAIAEIHTRRGLRWNHKEQQLPYVSNSYQLFSGWWFSYSCLAHIVNLGNVDVMKNITKIAVVENATAIWEYDPTRADNCVLGGSLDVIATIRTLVIKVSIHISHQFTSK